jgi:hypothetical protein
VQDVSKGQTEFSIFEKVQIRFKVSAMLKYIVDELCVNAVLVFVVWHAALEAFPCLVKGMCFEDDGVLNNTVAHMSKVKQAGCTLNEQTEWMHESAKAPLLFVYEVNPICSEVILIKMK